MIIQSASKEEKRFLLRSHLTFFAEIYFQCWIIFPNRKRQVLRFLRTLKILPDSDALDNRETLLNRETHMNHEWRFRVAYLPVRGNFIAFEGRGPYLLISQTVLASWTWNIEKVGWMCTVCTFQVRA